jgi:hypothetical protein
MDGERPVSGLAMVIFLDLCVVRDVACHVRQTARKTDRGSRMNRDRRPPMMPDAGTPRTGSPLHLFTPHRMIAGLEEETTAGSRQQIHSWVLPEGFSLPHNRLCIRPPWEVLLLFLSNKRPCRLLIR